MKIKKVLLVFCLFISFSIFCQTSYEYVKDEEEPIRNKSNRVELKNINRIFIDESEWTLGQPIPSHFESTITLEDSFFEVKMGKLLGYEFDSTVIAWNIAKKIVFLSTISKSAKTILGIGIGSTKEEVLELYGQPSIKTSGRFRYDNYDYEFQGIVFYFEENKVSRITCFAAI